MSRFWRVVGWSALTVLVLAGTVVVYVALVALGR